MLHVESDEVQPFTLGQLFDIWGVRLSATCLGGHCVNDEHSLNHQEIAIVYARRGAAPVTVPWIYNFRSDL